METYSGLKMDKIGFVEMLTKKAAFSARDGRGKGQ
jgi:hypothetical protein